MSPQISTLHLHAVTEDPDANQRLKLQEYAVFLEDEKPIILGSGRYALVLLASTGNDLEKAGQLFAVKLLKKDPESMVFDRIGRRRFFEEAASTRTFSRFTGFLVDYAGFGLLNGECILPDAPGLPRDEAIDVLCSQLGDSLEETIAKNQDAQEKIESAAQLQLQGPFMVLDAAYGTLDDLLVHKYPFDAHPLISHNKNRRDALITLKANCLRGGGLPQFNTDFGIASKLAKSKDYSGFSILKEIDSRSPKLANKIWCRSSRKS